MVVAYLITRLRQARPDRDRGRRRERVAARQLPPPIAGVGRVPRQRGDGPAVRVRVHADQRPQWPIVIAHFLLDTAAGIGFILFRKHLPGFG